MNRRSGRRGTPCPVVSELRVVVHGAVVSYCRRGYREIRTTEPVVSPDYVTVVDPTLVHQVRRSVRPTTFAKAAAHLTPQGVPLRRCRVGSNRRSATATVWRMADTASTHRRAIATFSAPVSAARSKVS